MPAVSGPPSVSRIVIAEDTIDCAEINMLWAVMMFKGKEYNEVLGFA